ncbi:MAG: hypothetical protein RMI49_05210 [Candidatus Caldarchaeum sp.]|nr:hypothetical protein [Candidatus Caldarchaeum sp.]
MPAEIGLNIGNNSRARYAVPRKHHQGGKSEKPNAQAGGKTAEIAFPENEEQGKLREKGFDPGGDA